MRGFPATRARARVREGVAHPPGVDEFSIDTGALVGVGPPLTWGASPARRSRRRHRAMKRLGVVVFLSVLWVAMPGAATRAAACTVDADCDNGDTCSVPDTCVNGG